MFLDVEELHSGSAKSLQSEFQRAADPIVQVPDSSSYAPTLPVSSQDYAPSASRRGRSNPAQQIMLPQDTALVQGADIRSSSTRTRTFADSNTTFNRFLLMSVSTSRLPMLEHVAVLQAENDTMLFQDLRSSYLAIRTAQTERFHPGTAKWIRFLSRKLRGLISCLQKYMIRLYGILGAEGIVPWVGDNLFFVPIRADYIKVRKTFRWNEPVTNWPSLNLSQSNTTCVLWSLKSPIFPQLKRSWTGNIITAPVRKTSKTRKFSFASLFCTYSLNLDFIMTVSGRSGCPKSWA